MAESTHEHPDKTVAYIAAWAGLCVLTVVTLGMGYVPLGSWSLPVAMLIATAKGSIVVFVFMHLIEHPNGAKVGLATSIAFVLLLISLGIADVGLRFAPAVPDDPRVDRTGLPPATEPVPPVAPSR